MSQAAAFVNASTAANISYYSNSFHLNAPNRLLACKQLEIQEKNYGPTCRVEWK
ncbi:MAG: hypothetical protein JNM63_16055 [Spirochaetia bacterium]|nr:hypothetical protein [Spirochaetia bacterium]